MGKEKKFGWGFVVFLFVAGVASLTLSGKVGFAEATAGVTIVCAVIVAGGLIGQKFGETYGTIVWWVGVPIASFIAYFLIFG